MKLVAIYFYGKIARMLYKIQKPTKMCWAKLQNIEIKRKESENGNLETFKTVLVQIKVKL